MSGKRANANAETVRSHGRAFLSLPNKEEWIVIVGLILVISALWLTPNIEMGSTEVEKMAKQNAAAPAKP